MKTDEQIQHDVIEELRWDPVLNHTQLGVAVKDGVVTLSGTVDALRKKAAAEEAAKRVTGVRAIAEDIRVLLHKEEIPDDTAIARSVVACLREHPAIDDLGITVLVDDGCVSLEGEIDRKYEAKTIETLITSIKGVTSVINKLRLKVAPVNKVELPERRRATSGSNKRSAAKGAVSYFSQKKRPLLPDMHHACLLMAVISIQTQSSELCAGNFKACSHDPTEN